jgi:hypothetical protein
MNQTWKPSPDLLKKQAFNLTILVFLISVVLRLPGLNRPISKHHEFVPATILMNISSWRQAGGGAQFHYTPLLSYQNRGDRHEEKAINIDDKGNQLYLSLGPGTFLIAYFFYQALHLPVEPIYLRILNLFLELATVILCFFFFESLIPPEIKNRYYKILAACALFMLSPGILWYYGNCYVHTANMMPFAILLLMTLMPMLQSSEKITPLRLLALSGLIIIMVYIDWFVAFLCFGAAIWSLYRSFWDKKYLILSLALGAALLTGIALIFWEFASYSSTDRLALYWKYRFQSRGFGNPQDSFLHLLPYIAFNLVTCYMPLLILLIWGIATRKMQKSRAVLPLSHFDSAFSQKELVFICLYSCSLLAYLLVLIDWSSGHEFSVVPAGLLLAYLGARWMPTPRKKSGAWLLFSLYTALCLGQYYFINRPGAISRDGMPFDTFETFGKQLRRIPPGYKIFSDLKEVCPMIEYYSGRNLTVVPDSASAKQLMRQWGLKTSVWAATRDFTLRRIDTLRLQ